MEGKQQRNQTLFHFSAPSLLSVFCLLGCLASRALSAGYGKVYADRRSGEGNAAGGAADRERVGVSAYNTVRPRQRQAGIASKPDTF